VFAPVHLARQGRRFVQVAGVVTEFTKLRRRCGTDSLTQIAEQRPPCHHHACGSGDAARYPGHAVGRQCIRIWSCFEGMLVESSRSRWS
jgi:hypothetical protein